MDNIIYLSLRSRPFSLNLFKAFPPLAELIQKALKFAHRARAAPAREIFAVFFELSIHIVANVAPGLGRRVRPLALPGRDLGQFRPSRTVL